MSLLHSLIAATFLSAAVSAAAIAEIAPPEMPDLGPLATEGDLARASGLLDDYRLAAESYADQARQSVRMGLDPAARAKLAARLNRLDYERRQAEISLAAAARSVRSGRPAAAQVAGLLP